ncbi:MAG: hypothetical protein ACYCT7_10270 [bacterium]
MENKETLFNIAKKLNLFWSYSKDIIHEDMPDEILIEKILVYGDINALILLFKVYPYDILYKVWVREIIPDKRFASANYFLAKFFFKTDINDIKVETRMDKLIKIMNSNEV